MSTETLQLPPDGAAHNYQQHWIPYIGTIKTELQALGAYIHI
jgi:hypothetical protein